VKRKRARPFSTLYYRKRVEQSTVAVRMRKTLFSTL
jgi:hypothetical protein